MRQQSTTIKTNLHPRNQYQNNYDFSKLLDVNPNLEAFVYTNEFGTQTIDFSDPQAVKALNKSILILDFDIVNWDIPNNYLCPPIPGRTDYIHYLSDLLATSNKGVIPLSETVIGLDIGVGANCIYPILGHKIYGWQFVGSDTDELALQNCEMIIQNNPELADVVSLQQQIDPKFIFKTIILPEDKFSFTICNPPFHASQEEAALAASRKFNALQNTKNVKPILNFGGQNAELWTLGGELGFITQMIFESAKYPLQVLWFSTLVSKKENLQSLFKSLNKVNVVQFKTIDMAQGQKISRILVWTFQTEKQHQNWKF
jgi:23S rRNA (adenine1618-N6)-methyltransferase